MKEFDAPETYVGQDSAIAMTLAIVHFFYIGYFFWQLLVASVAQWPDVFVRLCRPRFRRPLFGVISVSARCAAFQRGFGHF